MNRMGSVSMKAWGFVLFCFTCTSIEATQQDSCAIGMKTLAAKMDKLHADIKAIAHGLNLLNPQGKAVSKENKNGNRHKKDKGSLFVSGAHCSNNEVDPRFPELATFEQQPQI